VASDLGVPGRYSPFAPCIAFIRSRGAAGGDVLRRARYSSRLTRVLKGEADDPISAGLTGPSICRWRRLYSHFTFRVVSRRADLHSRDWSWTSSTPRRSARVDLRGQSASCGFGRRVCRRDTVLARVPTSRYSGNLGRQLDRPAPSIAGLDVPAYVKLIRASIIAVPDDDGRSGSSHVWNLAAIRWRQRRVRASRSAAGWTQRAGVGDARRVPRRPARLVEADSSSARVLIPAWRRPVRLEHAVRGACAPHRGPSS